MRILIVTRNLPPLWGGMERLNWHMMDELSRRAEVHVVGPAGAIALAPRGVKVSEAQLNPLPMFLFRALRHVLRVVRTSRPDVIVAGSGLTAPIALLASHVCGARAVAYVHGLDIGVPNAVYRALWWPALRRMDRLVANSHATAALAAQAGIDPTRVDIVFPGVSIPENPHDSDAAMCFRREHHLGLKPILLSVGRLTRRKGLREFVSEVLPLIVARCPEVMLVVIGDAPKQALHAEAQTPQSIMAAADSAGVAAHIKFIGVITDYSRLAAAYYAADVHVFPVQEIAGDPEGFGMVAIEAAAHGLPTVAYATGGVSDAVADGISGRLIPTGNSSDFADAVLDLLANPLPNDAVRHHAGRFAWSRFGEGIWSSLSDRSDVRG